MVSWKGKFSGGELQQAEETQEEIQERASLQKSQQEAQQEAQQEVVFDIPLLVTKASNIEEIKEVLGNPDEVWMATEEDVATGEYPLYPAIVYRKGDPIEFELIIYHLYPRVAAFLLGKITGSGASESKIELIKAGNLSGYKTATNYSVEFLRCADRTGWIPSCYTGVTVNPK